MYFSFFSIVTGLWQMLEIFRQKPLPHLYLLATSLVVYLLVDVSFA